MSRRHASRPTLLLGAALVAAIGLAVSGSALGAGAGSGAQACGTVTLNEQAWTGSTANTYVAKNVLENRLGCTVKITKITEIPVYQAMADAYRDRFDFTVTEVAARNTRSLRAHARAGFETLHVYPDATTGEQWHVIVLDFARAAPSFARAAPSASPRVS